MLGNRSWGYPVKFLTISLVCLSLALPFQAWSQARGGGGGGARSPSPTPTPRPLPTAPTSLSLPTVMFLTGKVVIDDGTPLTEQAGIQTICRGQKHTETHTDSHGSFSFQLGGQAPAVSADAIADADNSSNSRQGRASQRDWRDCEVQAVLAGFTSQTVELSSRMSSMEGIDLGRLVLHRLSDVKGFTVSVSSAAAPDKARKAYEKGVEQARKDKLEAAQDAFNTAVQVYPNYAVAWLELGRVNLRKHDVAAARTAFQRSLDADPKFVNPYEELAVMAAHDKQWQEVVDITGKLIALNPLLPQAWFLHAAGDYNLQKLDDAEKHAREGLKLDEEHRIPRLEYLLANILMQKQDYPQAAEHMRSYLQLSPRADEAEVARKQLADLEKQSAAAQASATPAPK